MANYKIVITEVTIHPDGVTAPTETEVFRQQKNDLDLSKFIRDLNTAPRRRKQKKAAAAQP